MRKPTSIRTLNMLIYLKLAMVLVILSIHFMLFVVPDHAWNGWDTFKANQLKALELTEYTSSLFGKAVLNLSVPIVIMVATLFFIRYRKFLPTVLLTLVGLFMSINPIQSVLTIASVVFLFIRSSRQYFRNTDKELGEEEAETPAEGEVIDVEGQAVEEGAEPKAAVSSVAPAPAPSKPKPRGEAVVEIRPATADDADTIHSVMLIAFEEYRATIPPSSALEETSEGIRDALESGSESAAILFEDDVAVAMVRYQIIEDSIYFFRLSVIPSKRRRGYAKRLVKWIEHQGTSKGLNRSRCKVRQTVQNNVAMYQDLGYEIIDQELVVRPTGSVKALTLEKNIAPV